SFVYQGTPLSIPAGWRIAASASQLAPIPVISLGTPTTVINFTADGRLDPSSLPTATPNTNPNVESPFPAIYLTDGRTARAVAVHPSGLVDLWQYDEAANASRGFGNRTIVSPSSLRTQNAKPPTSTWFHSRRAARLDGTFTHCHRCRSPLGHQVCPHRRGLHGSNHHGRSSKQLGNPFTI